MRVLRLIPSLDPATGGTVEALIQTSNALVDQGVDVTALTLDSERSSAEFPHSCRFRILPSGPGIGKYGLSRKYLRAAFREAQHHDVLTVEGVWQFHSPAGMWAALRQRKPYFVFSHGMLDPWFRDAYPAKHLKKLLYWNLIEHRVLRHSRAVIFTDHREEDGARSSFNFEGVESCICPLGISDENIRIDGLERPRDLPDGRYVLFLGRITSKKGPEIAVKAFLESRIPEDVHLVFVGPDDGCVDGLKEILEGHESKNRVHFLGPRYGDQRFSYMRFAECFLLPSFTENFGMVVAESLACSTPVLLSRKVNTFHYIDQDGGGIAFEASEPECRAAIERFFRDGDTGWRAQARACFEKNFTAEQSARKLLDIFHSH